MKKCNDDVRLILAMALICLVVSVFIIVTAKPIESYVHDTYGPATPKEFCDSIKSEHFVIDNHIGYCLVRIPSELTK